MEKNKFSIFIDYGEMIILDKNDYLFAENEEEKEIKLLIKGDPKKGTVDRIAVGSIDSSYHTIIQFSARNISVRSFGEFGRLIEYYRDNFEAFESRLLESKAERKIEHIRFDFRTSGVINASQYRVINNSTIKCIDSDEEFLYNLKTGKICSGHFTKIDDFEICSELNNHIKLAKAYRKVSLSVEGQEYSTELTCHIFQDGSLATDVFDSELYVTYSRNEDFSSIVVQAKINLLYKHNTAKQKEYNGPTYTINQPNQK